FVTPSYVAEVNGAEITQIDLNKAYRNRIGQLRQLLGSDYVPDDAATLKQQVLDALVDNQLLAQQALDAGYRVGNQGLVAQIHAMPAFSVGGKFNLDVYRARLRQAGYTPEGFENAIRQDLAVRQLRTGIAGSAIATGSEFNHFVALADEQRNVGYVTVSTDNYLKQAEPSQAEVEAYYKSHRQSFMTPDKVSIAYIELNADDIAGTIPVNEQVLRSLYQDKKGTFVQQEQRRAAHILIAPEGTTPEAEQKAKATAESVLEKIRNGGDFGKLAKKYSDDPGSAAKGGELGWIQSGELVKPFEKALFGADKVGAVMGPVKTQYGYHIIKLEGIRQPEQQSFEEVRDQLAADYRQQKAEDKFFKLGSQLSNLAFDNPNSLEPIHKALNLPIEKVSGVTRESGEGIAANAAVRDAAFSNEVYNNGKNHLVKLADTHVIVLRDIAHQPAELKPLAEVKPQIVKTLKHQAAAKQAEQVASHIAGQVQQGATLEAAVAAEGLKVQAPRFVDRSSQSVPQPILQAAFEADVPAASGKPSVGTVALDNGSQAVYVLTGMKPGNAETVTGQRKQMLVRRLVGSHAQADLAAYVADLRRQAEIDIQKDNIDNY
ncbi:MAG TPA: peptidylprolyl isomerase, partial [Gammaproteobacteria bacterium]|nr:peptidylprolyl isomerase [Gammaproteobacteria bacterium]